MRDKICPAINIIQTRCVMHTKTVISIGHSLIDLLSLLERIYIFLIIEKILT